MGKWPTCDPHCACPQHPSPQLRGATYPYALPAEAPDDRPPQVVVLESPTSDKGLSQTSIVEGSR
eukprot:1163755-Pyramimonas_sp.AAC.1